MSGEKEIGKTVRKPCPSYLCTPISRYLISEIFQLLRVSRAFLPTTGRLVSFSYRKLSFPTKRCNAWNAPLCRIDILSLPLKENIQMNLRLFLLHFDIVFFLIFKLSRMPSNNSMNRLSSCCKNRSTIE